MALLSSSDWFGVFIEREKEKDINLKSAIKNVRTKNVLK